MLLQMRVLLIVSLITNCRVGSVLPIQFSCQVWSPGLSPASGFEHPASTLQTRFLQRSTSGTVLPAA